MTKIGQQLQQQTQLSYWGYTNKNDGDHSQKEGINTQAQNNHTEKISDPLHHIVETMMVELLHTTFRIPGEIFWMETLFTAHEKEVALDPLMYYKSTSDTDIMYLHETMKQPHSNEFNKDIKK